jgi:hypothetical protein
VRATQPLRRGRDVAARDGVVLPNSIAVVELGGVAHSWEY